MKDKWVNAYFDIANVFANLSSAVRLKVGAVIVKNHQIISCGYNGTPSGWSNDCEITKYDFDGKPYLETKPEVIHAEANALFKLAQSNESGLNATMFVTHCPCVECAKGIVMSGISTLYYEHGYRSEQGLDLLRKSGVTVFQRLRGES